MARTSYEAQAKALAAEKNIELTVEVDTDDDFSVELWGYNSHMSFDGTHTSIVSFAGWGFTRKSQVWNQLLQDLNQFDTCPSDCVCYKD